MKGLACVFVLLAVCTGASHQVQASDRPAEDGVNLNNALTTPGHEVSGRLREPGLESSNTQEVFPSSSSEPRGFKGAAGNFDENGAISIVDENGHARTIYVPAATHIPWWRCWPFWRSCRHLAATSDNSFTAAGTGAGRKLADFGGFGHGRDFAGRGFEIRIRVRRRICRGSRRSRRKRSGFGRELADFGGFEQGRDFGGHGFENCEFGFGGESAAAAAAAAASSGFGRKLAGFGGFGDRGFGEGRGFENREFGFGGESAAAAAAAAAASAD
ncbi:hypothetical protein COCSUDRAFT_45441 [Coccomyxa subellipsoidea C-169]|uniref:Uncharacterized protein n=1 Tax=Coccomyxa subellipsoidea (strain C-169) TaxID=574566 RepID=I0YJ27_COCSC|nr:hypothetical protein COCSUDRAFT_45441 [Coccomyxa subellipsoidea C-169]EIE18396.1 hypothetical protein COCSUDRAFT_45441 [Coccomyxa subellipsoidea C-169]|eukprot:XP_005642940.1 hypothetical protein COCSUDRAFT_45441 [Coccomyxa subellipsoidea C-169]